MRTPPSTELVELRWLDRDQVEDLVPDLHHSVRRYLRPALHPGLLDPEAARGRDDAHIGLDDRVEPSGMKRAILQEAQQLGLQLERHVADLVEEQRAAVGLLD